ncbi:uncharacterized protein LOC117891582 isoform X1 [Drosophila subobscura]|uniref:uncharacterized protein LOC117891582 isoform X1 n=1 Tax=Drosophila subobscura TaxID=7241 RepID=UPI00155AAC2C|nr:uncharacterized protein LOC117891582 isoform X1 [Drosophila subobscura]
MHKTHRLTESQYMEVEGLLQQAMDMPSSREHDQDGEIEPEPSCRLSRYNVTNLYDGPVTGPGPGFGLSAGPGRQRCYTMPHVPPPAPPSTPTLLTSANSNNSNSNGNCSSSSPTCSAGLTVDTQLNQHFIYVKNGKNLRRESRCVDSELSKLFNVVSITNRLTAIKNRSKQLQLADRGIINASRTISKLHGATATATKIFKIHRDPKDFLRETDEDSVSAPEYDEEEEDTRFRFFRRTRHSRRHSYTRMERKFARFEHHERMETIVDSFDAAMNFNDADT